MTLPQLTRLVAACLLFWYAVLFVALPWAIGFVQAVAR